MDNDRRVWSVEIGKKVYKTGLKRREAADIYRELMDQVTNVHITYRSKRK